MQLTLHFLLFKNCKNGYALPSKSRIAKFFPRLSSGGFWKGRFENWAELQTYLRRDIRQSGKSDFRWSTSAGFPVFIQSGINYPPGRLLWQSADNQMVQTVRLEACGASYQTKRTQNIFMLSYPLTYSILLSPTSQRLAVRLFSPERETCCMLPICSFFAFLPFTKEYSASSLQSSWGCIVLWTPVHTALHPLRIHTPVNHLMHTDNKRSSFLERKELRLLFFFWKNFCILSFYKRTFCFTPAIPTGFHSSEPKAHLSYTLSSASVIPAGIIHSVFVPRLPVMVSLFHTPLAE